MRRVVATLLSCFCLFLTFDPAAARSKKKVAIPRPAPVAAAPAVAPIFPFFGFWRAHQMTQPRAHYGVGVPPQIAQPNQRVTASTSTGCLPMQLRSALADVQARFGPVQVISTHRPGARIRGGHMSKHATCQAVDFKPAPGTYRQVASYLRASWQGGFGTYTSGHIHIDTGPHYTWHN
jgi:hypothetical protein